MQYVLVWHQFGKKVKNKLRAMLASVRTKQRRQANSAHLSEVINKLSWPLLYFHCWLTKKLFQES